MQNRIVEWDPAKERINLRKHGVSFEDAASVFDDTLAIGLQDDRHSHYEERMLIIGYSVEERLLLVAYTEHVADIVRIISARRANSHERRLYEEASR
jgi:uncharacterized DUF497 family protein